MNAFEVIQGIQQGNDKVLDALYKSYRSEFIAWALREFKADQNAAVDIWQDCVVIFYEGVIGGRIETLNCSLKTYLFAIGKNILLKQHKWNMRHGEIEETMMDDMAVLEFNSGSAQEEKMQMVESALVRLGDPCRQLLLQYYYNRRSVDDIARSMGYNNGDTAKNMKYKCMQRLKKMLIPV